MVHNQGDIYSMQRLIPMNAGNAIKAAFSAVAVAATFLIVGSTLTGCAGGGTQNDPEKEGLRQRVSTLESENLVLKTKLEGMQKALEFTNAVQSPGKGDTAHADSGNSGQASGSAAPIASATTPASGRHLFVDLEEVPTADMIDDLNGLHIFDESSDKFGPYRPITRGEYVTWLYKSYNAMEPAEKKMRPAPQLAQVFTDVPPTHPAYKYIQAVANAGYSIGYKDGTFRPDKPLTREEMLGIKVGVDLGKDLDPWRSQMETVWKFSDGKDVDERFTGYVHQDFYVSGPRGGNIQRAFGKIGKFQPKQPVTRCEAAATLWQFGQFGDTQRVNAEEAGKADRG